MCIAQRLITWNPLFPVTRGLASKVPMGQVCSGPRASKRSLAVNQRDFQIDDSERLILPRPSPFPLGVIYPLYGEYHQGDPAWDGAIAAAHDGYHVIAILRPTISDLPEYAIALTEEYRHAVRRLTDAGVICIGHINTSQSSKTMWDVEAELTAFASWREHDDRIGLAGVYFDHTSCDDAEYAETYYEHAAGLTRQLLGPLVVFGARGVPRSLKYREYADIIITFHDDWAVFTNPKRSRTDDLEPSGPLPGTLACIHPLACVVKSIGKARTHNPEFAAYQAEVRRMATSKFSAKEEAEMELQAREAAQVTMDAAKAEKERVDERKREKMEREGSGSATGDMDGGDMDTLRSGEDSADVEHSSDNTTTATTSTSTPASATGVPTVPPTSKGRRKSTPSIEAVSRFLYTPLPPEETIARTLTAVALAKKRGFGWVCMLNDEEKPKRHHNELVWAAMLYGIQSTSDFGTNMERILDFGRDAENVSDGGSKFCNVNDEVTTNIDTDNGTGTGKKREGQYSGHLSHKPGMDVHINAVLSKLSSKTISTTGVGGTGKEYGVMGRKENEGRSTESKKNDGLPTGESAPVMVMDIDEEHE